MRLLVTRPDRDSQRTAAVLRDRHHDVIVAPLLRVEFSANVPTAPGSGGAWDAILLTSANAVDAVAAGGTLPQLHKVPVFAVGHRTARAAQDAGFGDVQSADGNMTDLVRKVGERIRPQTQLLYLAGEDRAGDLAGELHARGFAVHTATVYRVVASPILSQEAQLALRRNIDGVLHYSRRSAAAFLDAARAADLLEQAFRLGHYCLSTQVAEPLALAGAQTIHIASRPNETALIAMIAREDRPAMIGPP